MTVLKLVYWLVLLPFLLGFLPLMGFPEKERTPDRQFVAGFLLMLAVFQLFAVPAVLWKCRIDLLVTVNVVVTTLLAAAALVGFFFLMKKKKIHIPTSWKENVSKSERAACLIYWCLFLGVLLFQMYMAYSRASFDGDDAFYVAQSVMAQQDGSMYEVDPYTGAPAPFDARHATATVTMWIAVVARLTEVHAAVLSHTVLPLVLLPLVYLVYCQVGKLLIHGERSRSNLPVFMLFMAFLQMYGYVSLYTKETFLMTRTWQGKAMVGNIVFPVILWILLYCVKETPTWGYWLLLLCVNTFAAMCSSLGAFLVCVMIAVYGVVCAARKRSLKLLLQLALSCVPCVIYIGMYVLLIP